MKKDCCLYTCKYEIDKDEYKKMMRVIPNYFIKVFVFSFILTILLVLTIGDKSSLFSTVFSFILIYIFLVFVLLFNIDKNSIKKFEIKKKNNIIQTSAVLEFYNDYFIFKNENIVFKMSYLDISKCIETETNFYLKLKKTNRHLIIKKDNCSSGLIDLFKNKFALKQKKEFRIS